MSEQAARLSTSTLAKWRVYGTGVRFVRLSGNRVAYPLTEIGTFLRQRLVSSTAEADRLDTRAA